MTKPKLIGHIQATDQTTGPEYAKMFAQLGQFMICNKLKKVCVSWDTGEDIFAVKPDAPVPQGPRPNFN